jgi:hypothetical protein
MIQATQRNIAFTDFELRQKGDTIHFTGYASTFDQPYDMGWYTENVRSGAFTKTLNEAPDVTLLVNHEGLPLARTKSGTLKLAQDTRGLHTGSELEARDPDVQKIQYKMERGDMDRMSFAFGVVRDKWSEDLATRDMVELSLNGGDVSLVTHPANPNASATLRSLRAKAAEDPEAIRSLYRDLMESRAGAAISAANAASLRAVLDSLGTIDEQTDSAQAAIADLLGLTLVPEQENSAPRYDALTVRLLARIKSL